MEKRDMEIDNAMLLDFGDEPFGSEEVVYDLGLGEE